MTLKCETFEDFLRAVREHGGATDCATSKSGRYPREFDFERTLATDVIVYATAVSKIGRTDYIHSPPLDWSTGEKRAASIKEMATAGLLFNDATPEERELAKSVRS